MDRRQALRNIGFGAGVMVATPTVISLLQSCKTEADKPAYVPVFTTAGEFHALTTMVDLMIPSDETVPGAVDVGVPQFIDSYWQEVTPSTQGKIWAERYEPLQANIKTFLKLLADEFRTTFNKELEDGEATEFDQILAKYLKSSEEEQRAKYIKMSEFYEAYDADPTTSPDPDAAVFSLVAGIRGMSIWAWKSSEEIGKNVLWYDPVPGQQKGCIPLSEAGNGNAMAL